MSCVYKVEYRQGYHLENQKLLTRYCKCYQVTTRNLWAHFRIQVTTNFVHSNGTGGTRNLWALFGVKIKTNRKKLQLGICEHFLVNKQTKIYASFGLDTCEQFLAKKWNQKMWAIYGLDTCEQFLANKWNKSMKSCEHILANELLLETYEQFLSNISLRFSNSRWRSWPYSII